MEKSKRKEKEFRVRRAEILEEAEKIFASKGFHSATMAEIAQASGFASGTLYQFFDGKENLYASMIMEKLDRMYGEIQEAVAEAHGTVRKLEALVQSHFRFVELNIPFWKILIRAETVTYSEENASLKEDIINRYFEHNQFIGKIIKEGIRMKYFKSIDPHAMACALNGIMSSFKFIYIIQPEEGSLTGKVPVVLDIFLRGVKRDAA